MSIPETTASGSRESWGSRFGFIMATAGFAVGLGNIWRFPYVTGSNGGAAFLLVYVAFSILIGIPLLTAEIGLGRKVQLTPLAGMKNATGSALHPWNAIAWMGTATATIIMGYYLMLLGWIVGYLVMAISGSLAVPPQGDYEALYEGFVARPGTVLAYTTAITVAMCAIVWMGVRKGVERLAQIGMPLFFLILLALAIRSLTLPGAAEGLCLPVQHHAACAGEGEEDPSIARIHEGDLALAQQSPLPGVHQFADHVVEDLDGVFASGEDRGERTGRDDLAAGRVLEHSVDVIGAPGKRLPRKGGARAF